MGVHMVSFSECNGGCGTCSVINIMKEPELVLSGFVFLVPAYVAWMGGQWVSAVAMSFLVISSTIWHTIHQEWFRPIDFLAMVTVALLELYNSVQAGVGGIVLALLVTLYALIAYHWGYIDSTFCFGPSRGVQRLSHAVIHIVAAVGITLNLWAIQCKSASAVRQVFPCNTNE